MELFHHSRSHNPDHIAGAGLKTGEFRDPELQGLRSRPWSVPRHPTKKEDYVYLAEICFISFAGSF